MLTFYSIEAELITRNSQSRTAPVSRAKIPGGILVGRPSSEEGLAFVPDPEHAWDGNSLP